MISSCLFSSEEGPVNASSLALREVYFVQLQFEPFAQHRLEGIFTTSSLSFHKGSRLFEDSQQQLRCGTLIAICARLGQGERVTTSSNAMYTQYYEYATKSSAPVEVNVNI